MTKSNTEPKGTTSHKYTAFGIISRSKLLKLELEGIKRGLDTTVHLGVQPLIGLKILLWDVVRLQRQPKPQPRSVCKIRIVRGVNFGTSIIKAAFTSFWSRIYCFYNIFSVSVAFLIVKSRKYEFCARLDLKLLTGIKKIDIIEFL